jgi:NAD(P)H-dependent FMN reductase
MTHHRIAIIAGSTRRASVNSLLAREIADALARRDRDHLLVDLAEHDMPLYHGDLEEEQGVPDAARRVGDILRDSGGLMIATPEYNGSFSPLLKNSIDWTTRVDMGVLRDTLVGLAAASPGRGGGVRGLAMVRTWFENMRLIIASTDLSIPLVYEHLTGDADAPRFDDDTRERVATWVDAYLVEFDEYCTGRPAS